MNQNIQKRPRLPKNHPYLKSEISLMKGYVIGIMLGLLGNVFVNASFELLKNPYTGLISNSTVITILIICVFTMLIPIYIIGRDLLLIKNGMKYAPTIVAIGNQEYTLGDKIVFEGTCISDDKTVAIKLFNEKYTINPRAEITFPIADDFTYRCSFDTSGLEPELYKAVAENNYGLSASVSLYLVDKGT